MKVRHVDIVIMFCVMAHRVGWRTGTNVSRKEQLWRSRGYVRTKRSCAPMRMYGVPNANIALWTWKQKTSLRSRRIAFRRSSLSPSSRNNFLDSNFDVRGSTTSPLGPGFIVEVLYIVLRHITVGRALLGERSARRRDLYLTTHSIHSTQTSMLPTGFEPTVPVDPATTGTGGL